MPHRYTELLLQSPLFRGLTGEQLAAFLDATHPSLRNYSKNSFIAISGEPMEGIGVLIDGQARLTRENVAGQRSIVTDLTAPQMFGEVLLFTDNPLWPATVESVTATKVIFLPPSAFTDLVPGCEPYQTQLLINLLHDLSEKAFALTRKVHYLTLKGMREKIFAYVIDIHKRQKQNPITIPHNRQEMADVLNVSRTALSRELGRLADERILYAAGRSVTIYDFDAIRDYEF